MGAETNYTRRQIFTRIGSYLKRLKRTLITVFGLKILLVPVMMAPPFLFRMLIDDVLAGRDRKKLVLIIGLYIAFFVFKSLLDLLLRKHSNKLMNRFSFDIRKNMWDIYFRLPFAKKERMSPGDLKLRLDNDVTMTANMINEQLIDYLLNIFTALAYLGFMLAVHWQFASLVLLSIPVSYVIGLLIAKGTRNVFEKIRTAEGEYRTWQYDSFQAWKEVKANRLEKREYRRFLKYRHHIARLGVREIFFWYLGMLLHIAKDDFFTKLLIYLIGGLFILAGDITVGTLILFTQYFTVLFENMDSINQKNISLKGSLPSLERIFDILDMHAKQGPVETKKLDDIRELSLRDIYHSYEGASYDSLKGIDLDLKRGEHMAIVGRSGSGKTTLVKLILGLYAPKTGTISVNNSDLKETDPHSFYLHTGTVMQDGYLFNISIRDNLLIARPGASEADLDEACKKADIHAYIQQLPSGYDTVIGEKGIRLSGGQRQRLQIARVFLRDPDMIIFDEATSSVDFQSEKSIISALDSTKDDKLVIVIAHRFSSVLGVDRIIVMENGRIIDQGQHETLMKRCPVYVDLYNNQMI